MIWRKTDVLFVCASPIDEVWVRSTFAECLRRGLRVRIEICETGFAAAARVRCRIAVTASSGVDRVMFPTKARWFVHMPHSLASLHMIYPHGAFDGYDLLFSSGPHHDREFAALTGRPTRAVGYGKLDLLAGLDLGQPCDVLIAPSWGPDNLLDRCGVALVNALRVRRLSVVVRPHPLFFVERAPVIDELVASGASIENPFDGDGAIRTASVLVGDWSGTGFEFAALTRRPVVSVDVGRKIVNTDWEKLDMEPVEVALRSALGPVVKPNVDEIVEAVESTRRDGGRTDTATISRFLHGHPGECASRAADALQEMLDAA